MKFNFKPPRVIEALYSIMYRHKKNSYKTKLLHMFDHMQPLHISAYLDVSISFSSLSNAWYSLILKMYLPIGIASSLVILLFTAPALWYSSANCFAAVKMTHISHNIHVLCYINIYVHLHSFTHSQSTSLIDIQKVFFRQVKLQPVAVQHTGIVNTVVMFEYTEQHFMLYTWHFYALYFISALWHLYFISALWWWSITSSWVSIEHVCRSNICKKNKHFKIVQ